MRKLWLGFVFLFLTASTWAQVTITGQVVDTDGQQWIGGTYTVSLVTPSGSLAYGTFWNVDTGQWFQPTMQGILDGTGSFSVSLIPTQSVKPDGTKWKFTVCPQVTGAACGSITIPINAAGSVSSQINAVILAPRVTGGPGINAYSDIEVAAFAPNTYFNVISQVNRCYSTSWGLCTGGGSSLPTASAAGQAPVSTGPGVVYTAQAVLMPTLYIAGSGGVVANTLVMGDGSGNVIPFVSTSTNYGLYVGVATSTAAATAATLVANTSGQLAACQFDGTPVLGDAVIGSTSTPGDCHDNGDSRLNIVGARIPVIGWVQSVSGTVGTVRLAGLGLWGSGNIIVNNTLSTQTLVGALTLPGVNTSQLGTIYYVDGFNSTLYPGIGVAQTAWNNSTNYQQCTAVSYSSANYLEVAHFSNLVTPGTNSTIWYPVTNGATPSIFDCAFYVAAASIVTGTGTVTNGNGASVQMGVGTYITNIGITEPTVSGAGNPVVNIYGQGRKVSTLQQGTTKTDGFPTLIQPDSLTNYAFPSFVWQGFAINSNFSAPAVAGVYGSLESRIEDVLFENPADLADHYVEFGHTGGGNHADAWVYELTMMDAYTNNFHGGGGGGVFTVTVSGGTLTIAVNNGGTYNTTPGFAHLILSGTGSHADQPCTSRGTDTFTFSGNAIATVATTASGCTGPVYASVQSASATYAFKFNDFTDSHEIVGLIPGAAQVGIYMSVNTCCNTFTKAHPIATSIGIQDYGNNTWVNTQIDSVYRYGFDFEGGSSTTNVYGTLFEWNAQTYVGSSDYHFGAYLSPPVNAPFAINIFGDSCGNQATFNGYNHFLDPAGSIDASSNPMPSFVHAHESTYCNQIYPVQQNVADYVGASFNWSPGYWGNDYNWAMSAGGANTAPSLTLSNSIFTATSNAGTFTLNLTNPNAATSSLNYRSPLLELSGAYWDGTVTQPFGIIHQLLFASGSGPLATFATTHTGTIPAGGFVYSWDGQIKSTVSTGTAPFIVASTTTVANLAATTATTAANLTGCTGTGAGDFCYFNGTSWTRLAGNTSGTQILQETASGVPSWTTPSSGDAPAWGGYCSGVASSSFTVQVTGTAACNAGIQNYGTLTATRSGTLSNLAVRCHTTGVSSSSGVFTVVDTPSGTAPASYTSTPVTVTYGTTTVDTTVSDTTHTYNYAAGDMLRVIFTTQASETLGSCSVSFQY